MRMQFLRGIRVILSWLRTTQWSDSKKIVQNIRFCLKIYHGLQFIHHRSLKSTFVWKIAIFLFSSNQQVLGCLPLWITKIWHLVTNTICPGPTLPKPWFCLSGRPFQIRLTWILVHQCPSVQILIFWDIINGPDGSLWLRTRPFI